MIEAKINLVDWESQVYDRSAWRAAVREAVNLAAERRMEALETKRANRKTPNAERTEYVCTGCGRDCKARIGLLSHAEKCNLH